MNIVVFYKNGHWSFPTDHHANFEILGIFEVTNTRSKDYSVKLQDVVQVHISCTQESAGICRDLQGSTGILKTFLVNY